MMAVVRSARLLVPAGRSLRAAYSSSPAECKICKERAQNPPKSNAMAVAGDVMFCALYLGSLGFLFTWPLWFR